MRWNAHPPNERGAPRDMVGAAVGRSGFATKLITMYCHETRNPSTTFAVLRGSPDFTEVSSCCFLQVKHCEGVHS